MCDCVIVVRVAMHTTSQQSANRLSMFLYISYFLHCRSTVKTRICDQDMQIHLAKEKSKRRKRVKYLNMSNSMKADGSSKI